MDLKAANHRKRKKANTANKRKKVQMWPLHELLDEIVWEILIWLPVESLVRFKSVCKAWHSIISNPSFVRAHLHLSKQRQKQNPSSFLITPSGFYLATWSWRTLLQRLSPLTSASTSGT